LREPIGEHKGIRWLLTAVVGVKQVGVRRGYFIARVTLCLRAFTYYADSTWHVT
jgi:hypothetical protein